MLVNSLIADSRIKVFLPHRVGNNASSKDSLSNLYINFEYGVVSKYTYARDSNFNYEYVRDEYPKRYDIQPPSEKRREEVNRIGNFLGFMYGPNSDCIDIAIGWRNDLKNVKEYTAGYQADEYFYSFIDRYDYIKDPNPYHQTQDNIP